MIDWTFKLGMYKLIENNGYFDTVEKTTTVQHKAGQ